MGEQLAPLPFDLRSDPEEPGLECSPFLTVTASTADTSVFDNGLPLARTDWIAGGRLARLRYHRAGAARSGVEPAGFIDNLILEVPGATGTMDELVARTERGLLLTCLWYIREVDPTTMLLTGLTRDGVYVVEDGEVVGAANNFRFNESPVDLLARATEVGLERPGPRPGVRRVLQPDPDAAAPRARLQHELGQPGQLIRGRRRPPSPVPPLCVRARNGVRGPDGREESLVGSLFPRRDRAPCVRYVASGGLPTVGPGR